MDEKFEGIIFDSENVSNREMIILKCKKILCLGGVNMRNINFDELVSFLHSYVEEISDRLLQKILRLLFTTNEKVGGIAAMRGFHDHFKFWEYYSRVRYQENLFYRFVLENYTSKQILRKYHDKKTHWIMRGSRPYIVAKQ